MSLFDRFKKKEGSAQGSQPPVADTQCLLLMDRVLEDIESAARQLKSIFGEQAVGEIDHSHPRVPAFIATIEGLEFWCSYLPMPIPADTADIPASAQYNFLLTDEEKQDFIGHKSFWVLAQKGGGTSLEEKRRVCWVFSTLCAALLEQEGAVGVKIEGRGGLLVSKRHYLQQRELMEGKQPANDEGYFPVPLWVWVYGSYQGETPIIRTMGLKDFGLPELGFYNPRQFNTGELLNFLYSMSCLQITGRQLYRNAAVIPLDEKTEVVCKRDKDVLFFFGA
ncbi:MAG: hypothetical protein NC251_07065 [Lachnoclostridium sp.]|nr:hypothetical protein [Lachnospira sp.]MCM1248172.1 hypothetical protein [Lachnoclostridium sp.]MCM1534455.1 hypothetical protein [Clostridium sp.]